MINHPKELRILVDLDAEKGVEPRLDKKGRPKENKVRIRIVPAKRINLEELKAYLTGTTTFSEHVLECITFMDHLLRETPKNVHINLRRSYFARVPERNDTFDVGNAVEAMKGVYQSLRATEGSKLVINVDVSNSCFWHQTSFIQLAYQLSGETDRSRFLSMTQPKGGNDPPIWAILKRLVRNKFVVRHGKQSKEAEKRTWIVNRISTYTAKTYKFDVHNRETNKTTMTSLFDYYMTKYGIRLDYWYLPLIETQKEGTLFPMEVCNMCIGQRYPYKLNENQVSSCSKHAIMRITNNCL